MKPITGSVNEKGMFTAKNPHPKPTCFTGGTPITQWHEFEQAHPQLLTYTPSNVLVTDEEHVEVVKGWRFNDGFKWRIASLEVCEDYKDYKEWEDCYIKLTPTEKPRLEPVSCTILDKQKSNKDIVFGPASFKKKENSLPDAKPFKSVDEPEAQPFSANYGPGDDNYGRNKRPLEAQPLEGVKTAQSILSATGKTISTITHIELLQCMEEYANHRIAQFATDAGGVNKLLTDCQEMLMNLIALNHVPDEVCPDMNDMIDRIHHALSAPSTHSSSEMVEEYKQALSKIRRVEILTPESEAMINKLLNK